MMALLRLLLTLVLTIAGAWVLGLLIFVAVVQTQAVPVNPKADAIVVLTGGEGRVAVGIELLAAKSAGHMLISGVHPETNKQNILPAQAVADQTNSALLACCVELGYNAGSTLGNAAETAAWAQKHNYRSIIVVTALYHVPRARVEFAQAMPDKTLLFYPVTRENVKLDDWWKEPWSIPGTVELIATEYSKYLFAMARRFSKYVPL